MLRSRRLYMLSMCESLFLLFCIEIIFSFYLDGSLLLLVLRGATYYRLRNVAARAKLRAYVHGISYAEAMSMSADSTTAPMGVSREIDDATTRPAVAAMQRLASRSRNGTTAMTDNHSNVTHAEPWSNSEPAAPPGAARLLGLNNYTNQATLDFHRALNLMMDGDGDVAHRNPRAINHMRRSTQNEGHGANHPRAG